MGWKLQLAFNGRHGGVLCRFSGDCNFGATAVLAVAAGGATAGVVVAGDEIAGPGATFAANLLALANGV